MHRTLVIGGLLALSAIAPSTAAADHDGTHGLVRTTFPGGEDPGLPFYARVELLPPYVFNDGEWAAVVWYRDPTCVPEDFNLITVFDYERAFGCELTVRGSSLWHGAMFNGAPKQVHLTGDHVPVWFVPWSEVRDRATEGGELTLRQLSAMSGVVRGHADRYTEHLHPHPDPAIGGGGHPNPAMVIDASGTLEGGGDFGLHISWIRDEVRSVVIDLG